MFGVERIRPRLDALGRGWPQALYDGVQVVEITLGREGLYQTA